MILKSIKLYATILSTLIFLLNYSMTAFLSPFSGTQVVSNLPPGPEGISISCFMYSDANALNSTCNERTDLICTKGCKGPFATATECQLLSGTDVSSASTTQVCSFDFGRDATAAKACRNSEGNFRCTGNFTGLANCSGCIKK